MYLMSSTIQIATTNITTSLINLDNRHVYCFDSRIALRSFTFNNGGILLRVDNGAALNLEITYNGEVT